jgi:putative phage-type endonuclease
MKIVNITQGTKEWHEFRQDGIGASQASVLLGINPWKKIDHLFFEKIGEGKPHQEPNKYILQGHELEPVARKEYEKQTGYLYEPLCAIHDKYDFIRCSFDGVNLEKKHLIEIKCPQEKTHSIAVSGKVPDYYEAQIQWQLMIAGYEYGDYVSYHEGDLQIVPVFADKLYQEALIEKAKWFWNCVVTRNPPGNPSTDEISKMIERYEELYFQLKKIDEEMEEIKFTLKDVIEEGKAVSWGQFVCRWNERTGTIDYKKIPELDKINLEDYRKPPQKYFEMRFVKDKQS